jgi:thiol-disulfide isomerase/thioredoxin
MNYFFSIIHEKDRYRKQPLPSPFFPSKSPVLEDQYGDLERLRDRLTKDEIIFVMYYAPWCSKCMEVRWEFHKAAVFMQEEVSQPHLAVQMFTGLSNY